MRNNMEEKLKKTYKGFVGWMIFFFAGEILFSMTAMKFVDENFTVFASFSFTLVLLDILTYIIYKTEYIYWYNGMPYDTAAKASSEERKNYAHEHMMRFLYGTFAWAVYGMAKCFFEISLWVDILAFMVIIITTAVSTIKIKLNTD